MTSLDFPRITDISQRSAGSPRVLIVRLSAVGDCLQTMPLACAVRDNWPDAHLTWVVERGAAPLVEACDAVDRVVVLPKRFATSLRLLARLRRELLRDPFDFTLDPQGLTKSGIVAWLSGASRRIGFARPAAREINPWLQTEVVSSRATHRVPQYLDLLRPLGIEPPNVRFGLKIPSAAEAKAAEFIAQSKLQNGYVAINPGAGWDSKRWPIDRYAELTRHLAKRGTLSVVTWGGPQECLWASSIVEHSQGAAILAPQTSLLELAAFLRSARFFVGSDTGPLHLAAAIGTPCIALFGASSALACGPFGSGHITLQVAHDQSAGRKLPSADNWAMRQIPPETVCTACDDLFSSQIAPARSVAA